MTQQQMTRKQILQTAWKRAYRNGSVRLEFTSPSEAYRMRFNLYNAVRPVKAGKEFDEELLKAAEACALRIEGSTITLSRADQEAAFGVLLAAFEGEVLPGSKTELDSAADASAARLLELLQQPQSETTPTNTRKNKFYDRDVE